MAKRINNKTKKTVNNIFRLRSIKKKCYFKGSIVVNYGLSGLNSQQVRRVSKSANINKSFVPTFDNDK